MLKWGLAAFFLSLAANIASYIWISEAPEATLSVTEYRKQLSQTRLAQRPGGAELVEAVIKTNSVPGDPSLVRVTSTRQDFVYGGSVVALLSSAAILLIVLLYRGVRWIFVRR